MHATGKAGTEVTRREACGQHRSESENPYFLPVTPAVGEQEAPLPGDPEEDGMEEG